MWTPTNCPTEERPIPLTLLRQKPPENYLLDAGDLLAVYVEGVIGERNRCPRRFQSTSPRRQAYPPAVGYPIRVSEDASSTCRSSTRFPLREDAAQVQKRRDGAYLKNKSITRSVAPSYSIW